MTWMILILYLSYYLLPGFIPSAFSRESNSTAVTKELQRIAQTFNEAVQQLVAEEFIQNADKLPEVNVDLQRNHNVLQRKIRLLEHNQSTNRKVHLQKNASMRTGPD